MNKFSKLKPKQRPPANFVFNVFFHSFVRLLRSVIPLPFILVRMHKTSNEIIINFSIFDDGHSQIVSGDKIYFLTLFSHFINEESKEKRAKVNEKVSFRKFLLGCCFFFNYPPVRTLTERDLKFFVILKFFSQPEMKKFFENLI